MVFQGQLACIDTGISTLQSLNFPYRTAMEASQNPPAIFRLPEEILGIILSDACDSPSSRYKLFLNISLTCKRFNRISRPFLYEIILIGVGPRPGLCWSPEVIHSRFQEDPSLRLHCRHLVLELDDISKHDYSCIVDVVNWLTNVRCLIVHGQFTITEPEQQINQIHNDDITFEYDLLDLLKLVARRMRGLEILHCYDTSYGRGVGCKGANFMRDIDIPSLKSLSLFGLGRSGDPCSNKVWRR